MEKKLTTHRKTKNVDISVIQQLLSDLVEKINEISIKIETKSEIELKLQAILSEFSVLKNEIQTRSNYHQRLLELQITALTVITGAALAYPFAGKWIILLIPIESAIFGLWWIEHSLVISEIGAYIHKSIELRISQLLTEKEILSWEPAMVYGVHRDPERRYINFRKLLFLTFVAPSIIVTLLASVLLMRSVPGIEATLHLDSLGISEVYIGNTWYLAVIVWLIGIGLSLAYLMQAYQRSKISQLRKKYTEKTEKLKISDNTDS